MGYTQLAIAIRETALFELALQQHLDELFEGVIVRQSRSECQVRLCAALLVSVAPVAVDARLREVRVEILTTGQSRASICSRDDSLYMATAQVLSHMLDVDDETWRLRHLMTVPSLGRKLLRAALGSLV